MSALSQSYGVVDEGRLFRRRHTNGDVRLQSSLHRAVFPLNILNDRGLELRDADMNSAPQQNAISLNLRRDMSVLYEQFLSDDGKQVDYDAMSRSTAFKKYVITTRFLAGYNVLELGVASQRAFFVNIYNALLLHTLALKGKTTRSLARRLIVFNTVGYRIAGNIFTLMDIEHGVLRGNRPAPPTLLGWRPFEPDDPRMKFVLPLDARVHFCLNCGARSCPVLRLHSPDDNEKALQVAAELFIMDDDQVSVHEDKLQVRLSSIFKFYRDDFPESLLEALAHMLPPDEPKRQALLRMAQAPSTQIKFTPYNWQGNGMSSSADRRSRNQANSAARLS